MPACLYICQWLARSDCLPAFHNRNRDADSRDHWQAIKIDPYLNVDAGTMNPLESVAFVGS